MSPHFLTGLVSRLLGLALVSWAFARVGVHRLSLCLPYLGVIPSTLLHMPLDFIIFIFYTPLPPPFLLLLSFLLLIVLPSASFFSFSSSPPHRFSPSLMHRFMRLCLSPKTR